MKEKTCPCCNNHAHLRLTKGTTEYFQCTSCRTLFSDPLNNEDMVGGGNEEQRNLEQNHLRIERIDRLTLGMQKEDVFILDFGCGHGKLVNDLRLAGYVNTFGYDCYNPEFSRLPEKNKYHIITAIEVCEHTSAPFVEMDVMYRSLVNKGVAIIESSYVNIADEEGIELEVFFYIEPSVGHATIFSHHGLDVLMCLKGFTPQSHFNRQVRTYQKLVK